MSRRSRSDAMLMFWLTFGGLPPQPETTLLEFQTAARQALEQLAGQYGYRLYADDFNVKDHRVLAPGVLHG